MPVASRTSRSTSTWRSRPWRTWPKQPRPAVRVARQQLRVLLDGPHHQGERQPVRLPVGWAVADPGGQPHLRLTDDGVDQAAAGCLQPVGHRVAPCQQILVGVQLQVQRPGPGPFGARPGIDGQRDGRRTVRFRPLLGPGRRSQRRHDQLAGGLIDGRVVGLRVGIDRRGRWCRHAQLVQQREQAILGADIAALQDRLQPVRRGHPQPGGRSPHHDAGGHRLHAAGKHRVQVHRWVVGNHCQPPSPLVLVAEAPLPRHRPAERADQPAVVAEHHECDHGWSRDVVRHGRQFLQVVGNQPAPAHHPALGDLRQWRPRLPHHGRRARSPILPATWHSDRPLASGGGPNLVVGSKKPATRLPRQQAMRDRFAAYGQRSSACPLVRPWQVDRKKSTLRRREPNRQLG